MVLFPNSACVILKAPDCRPVALSCSGWRRGLGKGSHPSTRAQASWIHCRFCCRQLWAAPGQVGAGVATSDP